MQVSAAELLLSLPSLLSFLTNCSIKPNNNLNSPIPAPFVFVELFSFSFILNTILLTKSCTAPSSESNSISCVSSENVFSNNSINFSASFSIISSSTLSSIPLLSSWSVSPPSSMVESFLFFTVCYLMFVYKFLCLKWFFFFFWKIFKY